MSGRFFRNISDTESDSEDSDEEFAGGPNQKPQQPVQTFVPVLFMLFAKTLFFSLPAIRSAMMRMRRSVWFAVPRRSILMN